MSIINNAIKDGTFFTNPILTEQLDAIAHTNKTVHIMGLLYQMQVYIAMKNICMLLLKVQ